jgi:plasmid stabilization system protein ParE
MKVLWTARALVQLEAIHTFIAAENRAAAIKVVTDLPTVADSPQQVRILRVRDVRRRPSR